MTINPVWFGAALPAVKLAGAGISKIASSLPFSLHGSEETKTSSTSSVASMSSASIAKDESAAPDSPEGKLQKWLSNLRDAMQKAGIGKGTDLELRVDGHSDPRVNSDDLEAAQYIDDYLRQPDKKEELNQLVNDVRSSSSLPLLGVPSRAQSDLRQTMAIQLTTADARWSWS